MKETIALFHTGYQEIREPDVHYGRKNADFGQGFYLSDNGEFAGRWARERKDGSVFVNAYELDLSGLRIHRFQRDAAWFDYIFRNRAGYADAMPEADVIIGPIANDTLYNTYGILTSGFLSKEEALRLLMIGPAYEQLVLKTDRAASQLRWLSARVLSSGELSAFRSTVEQEEAAYQKALAEAMEDI